MKKLQTYQPANIASIVVAAATSGDSNSARKIKTCQVCAWESLTSLFTAWVV
jgi:hypothetical protein